MFGETKIIKFNPQIRLTGGTTKEDKGNYDAFDTTLVSSTSYTQHDPS